VYDIIIAALRRAICASTIPPVIALALPS